MADTYLTHNYHLKSAGVNILIVALPDSEVNDKLATLAPEKGLLYKSIYEDHILGTCVVNSGTFFYFLNKRPELMTRFAEIRQEILAAVYKISPGFCPENIVINQNNLLKHNDFLSKGDKGRSLTDNDLWNQDPPLSNFGPTFISSGPQEFNPYLSDIFNPEDFIDEAPPTNFNGEDKDGGIKIGSAPYELTGHHWSDVGLYINVRKYEDNFETLASLIGGASNFKTEEAYHVVVVASCIEDYADILEALERMSVVDNKSPAEIFTDLYKIALIYNPFLKFEDLDFKKLRKAFEETEKKNSPPEKLSGKRSAQAGAERNANQSVQKKRFSDLPAEKLLALRKDLSKKIIGQDEALTSLSDAIQRAAVGLKREHEPLGSFLFAGSTGSGKTETTKALADCLDAHFVRIDCQDYQQSHEVAKLAGSPPGYVAHEDGGQLTNELKKYPFSVVLFDEIEKAHSSFHERLLQIIDDGVLMDNKGNKVSFKDAIIIMTSNIGVKEVASIGNAVGFGSIAQIDDKKAGLAREAALKKKFKPEFLNRLDEIIQFRSLDREDYTQILDILLEEVNQQVKKSKEITLNFSLPAKDFLLNKGIDRKYGARPLRRAVKRYVNTPLAKAILSGEIKNKNRVNISLHRDRETLMFQVPTARAKKD